LGFEVTILTVILLGLGAAAALALLEVVIRRSEVGAALILGHQFVKQVLDLTLLRDPVYVGPEDALFLILLTAAVARLLRIDRLTASQRLFLVLGLVVTWALIRGFGTFGIASSTNEARKFLRFFAVGLYFATLTPRPELLRKIGRMWIALAVSLCVLAMMRWVANAAGLTGGIFRDGTSLRVIDAEETLIVAQGALIALPLLRTHSSGVVRYLAPVLLVFVVLLQHRTVWIVSMVGVVYLLVRERALTPRVLSGLAAGLIVFSTMTFLIFEPDEVAVTDQLVASSQSTGTFEWRLEGWRVLLSESGPEGLSESLLGKPFGEGWARRMYGGVVDVSPHNFYVESYLRIGILGLGTLLLLYWVALRGPRDKHRVVLQAPGQLSHNVLQTVVGVQLLYYLSYSPGMTQAMLLGLGCAAATSMTAEESVMTGVESSG
jgi:hypothetical protein